VQPDAGLVEDGVLRLLATDELVPGRSDPQELVDRVMHVTALGAAGEVGEALCASPSSRTRALAPSELLEDRRSLTIGELGL
jgi:hypothetical protein